MTPEETAIFKQILQNREACLAWDTMDMGYIRPEISPLYEIRTVPHVAWQAKSVPILGALMLKAIEVLKKRLAKGWLEEGHGPYRNSWFVVAKKDGNVRLINSATRLNGVTIRDALLLRGCDEFAESFANCQILSGLDLLSGYDHCALAPASRDLTAFSTPLGVLRMTTLPQGFTNSPGHFIRVMARILFDIPKEKADFFFNDVPVKGPTTRYAN